MTRDEWPSDGVEQRGVGSREHGGQAGVRRVDGREQREMDRLGRCFGGGSHMSC